MGLWDSPSEKDGQEGDERREEPDAGQHEGDRPGGHDERVLERTHDGVVAVHRNAAQVQDRGRAEVDVERVPRVAPHRPERPTAAHVHAEVERHREQRHHYVRHRQRDLRDNRQKRTGQKSERPTTL